VSLAVVLNSAGGARGRSKFSCAGAVVCSSGDVAFAEGVVLAAIAWPW
jgi:hypothetical protein